MKPVGCVFKGCLMSLVMMLLPFILLGVLVFANGDLIDNWVHTGRVEIYSRLLSTAAGQVAPNDTITSHITLKAVSATCGGKKCWMLEVRYPADSPTLFDASVVPVYRLVGSRVTDFDVTNVRLIGLDAHNKPMRAVQAPTVDIVALVAGKESDKTFLTHVKPLAKLPTT